MTMFDGKLSRLINDFGDGWATPEYKFRQHLHLNVGDTFVDLACRASGDMKEFLRIPRATWDRCVYDAVRSSRAGGSYATRFFLWHWLEETNQLQLFFNKLKEMQNA